MKAVPYTPYTKTAKTAGVIAAQVNGAKVTVRLKAFTDKSARITVSARKMLLSKPEIVSGIIY